MGDLVLKGATSGQITLTPVGTAGTNTLTLPAKTGNIITSADSGTVTQTMLSTNVAGNGPAFSAYNSSATSISSGVFTKVLFQTEEFDTNNNFASSTFTPTVAGYYQVSANIQLASGISAVALIAIYKNGAAFKRGFVSQATLNAWSVSALIYLNGSTDNIELWAFQQSGSAVNTNNALETTYFQAALVRAG